MTEFHPGANDQARQANIAGDNDGPINMQMTPPQRTVTDTLPRDISTLVARDEELQWIVDAAEPGRTVSVCAVDGMPGVGKTALVTRAAHRLADQFPDGRFFVELNAHTPGQAPAEPIDVLAGLLSDLGVDPRVVPKSLQDRRNMWRTRSAGKRVLLILDDAKDTAQIEPLLPTGRQCLTLVTSRRRLIALDGAMSVPLDPLTPRAAIELFYALARRTPTASDTVAARKIVWLCGYLPLAIVLFAGRLAHHPAWTIAATAIEFASARDRLGELDVGERAVYAAFTMSYQDLPAHQQRLFRRLGLHPGPDIDASAAAALDDIPVSTARRELDALYTVHLIDETAPGRYRLHDLLRDYARTLAEEDPAHERSQAVGRLFHYYQHTAHVAGRRLARVTRPRPDLGAVTPTSAPSLDTCSESMAWLGTDHTNLLACLEYAVANDLVPSAIQLTCGLSEFLNLAGLWPEAIALHERAVGLAHDIGDSLDEANALYNLGEIRVWTDDYPVAAGLFDRALAIYQRVGNRVGEANSLFGLGLVRHLTSDYPVARRLYQEAVAIYRDISDRLGEATALNELGRTWQRMGHYSTAADLYRQATMIYQEIGSTANEGDALCNSGWVTHTIGDYPAAIDLYERALTIVQDIGRRLSESDILNELGTIQYLVGDYAAATVALRKANTTYCEMGNRLGEANSLSNLGWVQFLTGSYSAAADLLQRALDIYRETNTRFGEAEVLNRIGRVLIDSGDYPNALRAHVAALRLAREIKNPIEEARGLDGAARCRIQLGDHTAALTELRDAITIYRRIGAAEADSTESYLDSIQ
ncbi:ATP-binding protein [Nocardia sp. NBC_01327]|uniref:ATP-binding protein n=1 Tax=Nocardia sp. NBC_01327 TaxID=2903593 RepID=UPI002E124D49|nr:tetratricopeptide repeat protein [Nocardia sp. NBC_01327]